MASAPSKKLNPNVTEELQDMELNPIVLGPPAYGSPDPRTSAGRLVPVSSHPNKALISDNYGADVATVDREAAVTIYAVDEEEEDDFSSTSKKSSPKSKK